MSVHDLPRRRQSLHGHDYNNIQINEKAHLGDTYNISQLIIATKYWHYRKLTVLQVEKTRLSFYPSQQMRPSIRPLANMNLPASPIHESKSYTRHHNGWIAKTSNAFSG
jgi:hypothetical protein